MLCKRILFIYRYMIVDVIIKFGKIMMIFKISTSLFSFSKIPLNIYTTIIVEFMCLYLQNQFLCTPI